MSELRDFVAYELLGFACLELHVSVDCTSRSSVNMWRVACASVPHTTSISVPFIYSPPSASHPVDLHCAFNLISVFTIFRFHCTVSGQGGTSCDVM
jgi:hypothetical protein